MDKYELYFDGCSKGNPGRAGAGSVIYKNNNEIFANSLFIGDEETNNVAEYTGLIMGLEVAIKNNIKVLNVKGDSLLVIQQMTGKYQVKSDNLCKLYKRAKVLEKCFISIDYQHVYRKDNKRADELSNIGCGCI
jgi:ribonuclease HI